MNHGLVIALLILGGGLAANAQNSAEQQRGFVLYESFQGSTNSEGQVMTLGSSATYRFNEHFSAGVGIPIYFVRSSSPTGTTSSNGIGNFYADLGASWRTKTLAFASSLTGAAPTGNTDKG